MIQSPQPGDLIAEIPGKGPILTWSPQISAMFGGLLAEGRVVESAGVRSIEWKVDGMQRLTSDDGRVRSAVERLRTAIAAMRELAVQLEEQLRAHPDAERVRVGAAQVKALGGAERDAILARPEVEHYRALASLAAEAVERAIRRNEFFGDGARIRLVGWGFLPAQGARAAAPAALAVRLVRKPDEVSDGGQVIVLRWAVQGAASGVELWSRPPGAASMGAVPATATAIAAGASSGEWRFPSEDFPPGTIVRAMATAPGAVAQSGELRLGEVPMPAVASPAPAPAEPTLPEVPELDVLRAPATSDVAPTRVRSRIDPRLALATAAAAALVLALAAWMAIPVWFPPSPVVARFPALYVTVHVPPEPTGAKRPEALPGTLAPLPAAPGDAAGRVPIGTRRGDVAGSAREGTVDARDQQAPQAPSGGRRFAEFRTDRSARAADRAPPVRQPRAIAEFRTGLADFAPMADRQRLDGDSDAALLFAADATGFSAAASAIEVHIGIEVADGSKGLDEWAAAQGLGRISSGTTRMLLLDAPGVARAPAAWSEGSRKIAIGPGRIEVWGMDLSPVIAVRGAPDGCSARILRTDRLALGSRVPDGLALDGKPIAVWRIRALAGADGGDFQLSACDSAVRSIPFTLKGRVREMGAER